MTPQHPLSSILTRVAEALERLAPAPTTTPTLDSSSAWIWDGTSHQLHPVEQVKATPLELLHGIDHVRDILLNNTRQFAEGLPANNVLLWGARGMGKSTLVKAAYCAIASQSRQPLVLIEIQRDELDSLTALLNKLRGQPARCILFCDDLSFDGEDSRYKSLKTLLDGSIAGRPEHVLFYATSNRRHLMPRDMMENERKAAIHSEEAIEERVSLSDRFGLWLGFYGCDQQAYLKMVDSYAEYFGLTQDTTLHAQALEWAITRGNRSGRVAWQFITDLAGKQGKSLL